MGELVKIYCSRRYLLSPWLFGRLNFLTEFARENFLVALSARMTCVHRHSVILTNK